MVGAPWVMPFEQCMCLGGGGGRVTPLEWWGAPALGDVNGMVVGPCGDVMPRRPPQGPRWRRCKPRLSWTAVLAGCHGHWSCAATEWWFMSPPPLKMCVWGGGGGGGGEGEGALGDSPWRGPLFFMGGPTAHSEHRFPAPSSKRRMS